MKRLNSQTCGIALLELLTAIAAGATVLLGIAYFMSSGMLLFAKNVSTNLSHNSLRGSLDKLVQSVDQARGRIRLIDTTGTTIASGGTAPGVVFDQYRGGPYVVTHPGGSGLSAAATSLTITRSVDPLASPPLPIPGDVLLLANHDSIRLVVQSVSAGIISGSTLRQSLTITLQTAAGTAIPWDSSTVMTASLVRRVAFLVVPAGPRNELRYYNNAESGGNFGASADYSLVTNNIGTGAGDATPFSTTANGSRDILSVVLRVRAGQYANRLSTKELNSFSTVERVSITLIPKGA